MVLWAPPMIALMHLWNTAVASLWMLFLWKRLRYIADKQSTGELTAFFGAGLESVPVAFALYFANRLHWLNIDLLLSPGFFWKMNQVSSRLLWVLIASPPKPIPTRNQFG